MTVRDSLKLKSLALTGPAAAFSPSSSAKRSVLRWNNACVRSRCHFFGKPASMQQVSDIKANLDTDQQHESRLCDSPVR